MAPLPMLFLAAGALANLEIMGLPALAFSGAKALGAVRSSGWHPRVCSAQRNALILTLTQISLFLFLFGYWPTPLAKRISTTQMAMGTLT